MTETEQHADLFRMPALGADMTEGRIVEWYVSEGARAEPGDLVAVIETDKSDIEIEVFEPCVFDEFIVRVGETVPVGDAIARVTVDGPPDERVPVAEPVTISDSGPTPAPLAPGCDRDDGSPRRRMTPRARRLAKQRGVDPHTLSSTGTITGDTILRLAEDHCSQSVPERRTTSPRRAVARLMERSWAEIPHYHITSTLDLTACNDRLERLNAGRDIDARVVPAAVLYAAAARAAHDTPQVNGWWRDGEFVAAESVDLGIVLSLRTGGIVVPTIASADRLDTSEMMRVLRDLVERARRGRLRDRDLRPASISVTNMGELGADHVLGIIHPPQVALVGFGAPRLAPAVIDGVIAPRLLVEASVAGDHRAHDGIASSRLLRHLHRHLEDLP